MTGSVACGSLCRDGVMTSCDWQWHWPIFPSFNMFRQLFCQDSEQPVAARRGWASSDLRGVTVL